MFNKRFFLILGLLLLILIPFVSSAVPVQLNVNTEQGINVFYPKFEYVSQNASFTLHLHTSNISNGYPLANTDVDCFLHLYNPDGSHTFESNVLGKNANGWDHEISLTEGNFSEIGIHAFYIWCNSTIIGGQANGVFMVTESGVEITEGRSNLIIGLLIILVFFLFISLYALFNVEDYKGKLALYWVSHVLMILITFVGWQVGVEGLLGGMALTGVFRIMFWIFTVAVVPMIILSLVWIFYIHLFNEHFEKLIDKGYDSETAFAMAKKKSGGWFYGK